jgi:hypothetical protein
MSSLFLRFSAAPIPGINIIISAKQYKKHYDQFSPVKKQNLM